MAQQEAFWADDEIRLHMHAQVRLHRESSLKKGFKPADVQALGFREALICREQRIFYTTDLCGALSIAFLRSMLIGTQLPTNADEAAQIHCLLRQQFHAIIQQCQVTDRPWIWGAGDTGHVALTPATFDAISIDREARIDLINQNGTMMADDEIRFHIRQLVQHQPSRPGLLGSFVFLEPLVFMCWDTIGHVIAVSDQKLAGILQAIATRLGFRSIALHRIPKHIKDDTKCGAYAMAFLAHVITRMPLPTEAHELQQRRVNAIAPRGHAMGDDEIMFHLDHLLRLYHLQPRTPIPADDQALRDRKNFAPSDSPLNGFIGVLAPQAVVRGEQPVQVHLEPVECALPLPATCWQELPALTIPAGAVRWYGDKMVRLLLSWLWQSVWGVSHPLRWVSHFQLYIDFMCSTGHPGPVHVKRWRDGADVQNLSLQGYSFRQRTRWFTKMLKESLKHMGVSLHMGYGRPYSQAIMMHTGVLAVPWDPQRIYMVDKWMMAVANQTFKRQSAAIDALPYAPRRPKMTDIFQPRQAETVDICGPCPVLKDQAVCGLPSASKDPGEPCCKVTKDVNCEGDQVRLLMIFRLETTTVGLLNDCRHIQDFTNIQTG
ncbi:unnamed protein product [Cladocopium goreaui]|uniref:Uncharacterized protein n=1 Tax=Cladocopium goreaui TaxID=2562237 RepID=A0A9P1FG77_9DINO|nr:unnamed protein product [Cladocopium goreaui]